MNNRDKMSNIEALASYLLGIIDDGEIDEHFIPIFNAQTKEKDDDYVEVVKTIFHWAKASTEEGRR